MARRKAQANPEGKVEFSSESAKAESTALALESEPGAPDATEGPQRLVERVKTLEATVSALIFSTFGARDSTGRMMARCACGGFATRSVGILHPVAGHHYESLCDDCKPRSPLATEGVPQSETALLEPADRAMAVRVNRELIIAARHWGGS